MANIKDIDVAFLPCNQPYTMLPEQLANAVRMIQPKVVIPMHYSTFDHIRQDPEQFVRALEEKGLEGIALKPGEAVEI